MLMSGGGRLYDDSVLISEMSDCGPIVFGRTCVTADLLDSVSMGLVEGDHFFCSTDKTCIRLIANKDGVGEPAEEVFEHEEPDMSSDRWRADRALVINAECLAWEKTMKEGTVYRFFLVKPHAVQ